MRETRLHHPIEKNPTRTELADLSRAAMQIGRPATTLQPF
jgi:hypothetical protein